MRLKNEKRVFPLTGTGIDNCSEFLETTLEKSSMERQNRIRIRLLLEELLLRFRARFGETQSFQVVLSKRFGNAYLQVELEGESYNPLSRQENELEEWGESMLNKLGISPQFIYSGGRNILRVTLPSKRMNPVLRILIAVAGGILCGVILQAILPEETEALLKPNFLDPVYQLWMRILNLISGPIIFFMVVTTVLGMGRLSGKGANSRWLVGRYFLITAGIAAFIVTVTSLVLHMSITSQGMDQNTVSTILEKIFQIVPADLITPFINADTPQLILLAFFIGAILILLQDQVPTLVKLAKQMNTVGMLMAEWSCWLVPVFTFILLALEIEDGRIALVLVLWKPILSAAVMLAFVLAVTLVFTSLRKHVSVKILLQKLIRPFLIALVKGSLSASYGQTETSCVRQMGMDKEFTEVSLSHGLVLYMPASILGALIFTVRTAAYYEIQVTWIWYVMAVLLVAILMEAAPPVPGVSLLVYIVVFKMLGIPEEALIPAMVFDIVFSIPATAANQMMLQMEMIFQADRLGLINHARLREPVKK